MNIVILTPSIVPNDAVSNDVLLQQEHLRRAGHQVLVFAENTVPAMKSKLDSKEAAVALLGATDTLCLYHHSIYWEMGEALIKDAKCRLVMKYHNITPTEFFAKYHSPVVNDTLLGRKQTDRFVQSGRFHAYVGDSDYNSGELVTAGAPAAKTQTLAPLHRIDDFATAKKNPVLARYLADKQFNFLFVGRTAPNKGHRHLLETMREYTRIYGDGARLHIAGDYGTTDELYLLEIEDLVTRYKLKSVVDFTGKCGFSDLCTFYAKCDAFLLMSEHEGFCVPILEAQYHGMPVVALARAAVKETIGEGQFVFDEPDYTLFATALHKAASDKAVHAMLAAAGQRNYQRFTTEAIVRRMISVLGIA